jgi:outer membrane protein
MARFVLAAAAALALVAGGAPAQAQQSIKLGYINSQRILASAPGRAEAEAQFEREMSTYRTQVQKMGDSLNTLIAAYDKQAAVLSPAAKDGKEKEIRTKQEDYQNRVRQLEQQAQRRQVELVQPIMEQINTIIDQIRSEDGYSMIFDVGAQGGSVVAADTTLDITDKVLTRLKSAPPVAAKPGAPATKPAGAAMPAPAGVTRPKTPPGR